jgi:REP element-mobilizing transposase RayT
LIQVLINHDRLGFAKTLSFVVMPDHLHWLMQLGDIKNLGETVQTLKSLTTRRLGRTIFQKGFYDRALRQEEDIKGLAR